MAGSTCCLEPTRAVAAAAAYARAFRPAGFVALSGWRVLASRRAGSSVRLGYTGVTLSAATKWQTRRNGAAAAKVYYTRCGGARCGRNGAGGQDGRNVSGAPVI
jgi:hypothetical protein